MKKNLLLSLALLCAIAVAAQNGRLKQGIPVNKHVAGQKVAYEPVNPMSTHSVAPKPSSVSYDDGVKGFVNVITIGTSANAYSYGYGGGQKTMVWADDNLNALVNVHRMGPGSTPAGLSGYLAADLGVNLGQSESDWTNNRQIYASTLNTGGDYYLDAGRYPQGGIYNPVGNTDLANAYCAFFAPNLSNTVSTWGGYSYGSCNLVNQADSTKNMYWYSPPPYTYIPEGFTITKNGLAFYTDMDQNWESGSFVYMNNILYGRGVWNTATHEFDYTMHSLPFPVTSGSYPICNKIAASPDGNTVWILTLANNGGAVQIGDSANYYPVLFKSVDGGQTWSNPIAVQLDGPDGIEGVKNYLSDYRIEQLYLPPFPTRDQIPYTTAFDGDLVVDKWGNPHIGVIIGVSAGEYSIATADSAFCAFDIYSTDDGVTWNGVAMGYPWTFRGTYGDLSEDNRVQISSTQLGDKVFVTWNDTQMPGVTDNSMPDVFCRGFDLVTNKITASSGENQPNNVTLISEVSSSAWFHCMSTYIFTDNNKYTIPIVTEYLSVPTDLTQPVDFKYLTDFYYVDSDFSIPVPYPPFPVGVDSKSMEANSLTITPNPVKNVALVNLNLTQDSKVTIVVSNLVGQQVYSLNKGIVNAGTTQVSINAENLPSGVYMVTAMINDQKITRKMIVQ